MKITDVRTVLLSCDYPVEERAVPGGTALRKHAALVQVFTDEGFTGLGEVGDGAFFPEGVEAFVERFKSLLLGEDPVHIQRHWQRMYGSSRYWGRRGMALGVISGIEVALWDIIGQAQGLPVYRLLGGRYHDRIKAYAGGLPKPVDKLADQLKGYVEQGFTAVKVRIGLVFPGSGDWGMEPHYDLERDREVVRIAREAVGKEIDLIVDAGQGQAPQPWSASRAIKVARMLEQYGVFWMEEPCGVEDVEGCAAVAAAVDMPIAGGEGACTRWEFRQLIQNRAVDIVQPDVTHAGGLLECKHIAALASAYGVPVAPHCWWSGVGLMATLHFIACTPGCLIAEFSRAPFALRDELLVSPLRVQGGYIELPEVPGLGVRLPEDIIGRYPFQPGSTWRPN
jgi:L-alanine-DL-glutamate epimerase-like enolase superfamily enzyme